MEFSTYTPDNGFQNPSRWRSSTSVGSWVAVVNVSYQHCMATGTYHAAGSPWPGQARTAVQGIAPFQTHMCSMSESMTAGYRSVSAAARGIVASPACCALSTQASCCGRFVLFLSLSPRSCRLPHLLDSSRSCTLQSHSSFRAAALRATRQHRCRSASSRGSATAF